ncbi:MAG: Beta-barrel assembly-enhancing protease [Pseudorhodoplanes sp.]|nr:Beta-barrel assembly-enhancing protease [Pseudorhodoplanes sp.]
MRLLSPNRPRWGIAAASVVVSLALTTMAGAQSRSNEAQMSSIAEPETASGSYLAARHASVQRDAASAAAYFRAALRADPKNNELLERTFVSVLADGNIDEAARLADRLLQANRNDRVARLVVGVRALKQRQYAPARQNFSQSVRGPVTDLVAAMLSAWAFYGAGDTRSAVDALDKLAGPDWYGLFKDLHTGLILDASGNRKEAAKRLERAYKLDNGALRVVQAYGSVLSRLGQKDEALAVFEVFDKALPRHPLIVADMQAIKRGEKLTPLVETAQAGAAEALYGLGAALGRRGGEDLGLVYLQLALYLAPQNGMALLSLADIYEGIKKPELAIRTYERVSPHSPLHRNADIQQAINLDSVDRTEEAKARLQKLIAEHPDDLEAIIALGNILRARKSYAECGEVYSKAITLVPQPTRANWTTYYFRGICYERAKKWSLAEADMKKALELYPDQPHVLNYLGYSWVDQGINLDAGMAMIRRAVEQRPDDGYIVDSLGWAYYRLGNYDEAVKYLERAIELKPEDPTINDHLGDVYWKIGRTLEAEFQWSHARDLKPEPEELKKIEEKLRSGLPAETSTTADQGKKPRNGG